jgi:hypothetical protein
MATKQNVQKKKASDNNTQPKLAAKQTAEEKWSGRGCSFWVG